MSLEETNEDNCCENNPCTKNAETCERDDCCQEKTLTFEELRGMMGMFESTEKSMDVVNIADAKTKVNDIQVVGNGDMFQLLCKASSKEQGWMKSTKAMEVSGGCIVQVTTQQKNPDGSYALAEALTFVPNNRVTSDTNGGKRLVK